MKAYKEMEKCAKAKILPGKKEKKKTNSKNNKKLYNTKTPLNRVNYIAYMRQNRIHIMVDVLSNSVCEF